MVKQFLIGSSDYKTLIDNDNFYIDKTLLIKDIHECGTNVILLPRPRRFGKTLNMSMLKYFYEKHVPSADGSTTNTQYLFESMAIWKEKQYRKEQGQWRVISISLKDTKKATWDDAYAALKTIISTEFSRHRSLLNNQHVDQFEKEKFLAIMKESAPKSDYSSSFKFLSRLLSELYNKPVIVLIDEYDAPIHAGYQYGYYNEVIDFMREFLSGVLKDNEHLKLGVLTGILRVAKESIFSGLNNLSIYTFFEKDFFVDKFGFTQQEVNIALETYGLQAQSADVKLWYNGYQSGPIKVYNPWSVTKCISKRGVFENYWLNTSDNALVKQEIASCSEEVFAALESLLENKEVKETIDDGITMANLQLTTADDIAQKESAVWSLLLYTGYVTYSSSTYKDGKYVCDLKIPNLEVRALYRELITESVVRITPGREMAELRQALIYGDAVDFSGKLQDFVLRSMSSHDLYLNQCERNLHLFVLGILVLLEQDYAVRSNRESGTGRYDIMLLPKIAGHAGWIIELKKVNAHKNETLENVTDVALNQIKAKEYITELRANNVQNIVAVGIAVHGKKLLVKHEILQ